MDKINYQKRGKNMKLDKNKLDIAMARVCISACDLCKMAGVSRPNLHKMHKGGNCQPRTIGKIAKVLNVDVLDILKIDN